MVNSISTHRSRLNNFRDLVFRRLFRARFRYDVFISYSHRDAKDYAANLKKQLNSLDFSCFIDEEESPPGSSLDPTLARALRKSAVLVLLATERALSRPYVVSEFEKFATTERTIVPINILGALTRNNEAALAKSPWNLINERKLVWIDETDEAFGKQNPSPPIADGIDKLFKYTRRNVRVRAEIISTAVLVVLAAIGAGFVIKGQAKEVTRQAAMAEVARKETAKQQDLANSAGQEARRQLTLAAQASKEAERQGEIAAEAKQEAARQLEIARKATSEAEKQQRIARDAKAEADRQQAIAEAQLERNRHFLYDSNIDLAQRAREAGDLERSDQLLALDLPDTARTKSQDLRGFEWFYFWRLAHVESNRLDIDPSSISEVAFSPDSKLLASVSQERTVKIWDLGTRKMAAHLDTHEERIHALTFSQDSKLLATASKDRTIKIWDLVTKTEVAALQGHTGAVNAVAFSPDGRLLASGGSDKTVKLWSVETHKELVTLKGPTEGVNAVAFSPDGRFVLSGGGDGILWEWLATAPYELSPTNSRGDDAITCLAFSSDGIRAIGLSNGGVRLKSGSVDKYISNPGAYISSISFSGDGKTLATLTNFQEIGFWDTRSAAKLGTINRSDKISSIYSMAISPDGKTLVTGGRSIEFWSVLPALDQVTLNNSYTRAVAFSPDGPLATLSDHKVRVWDPKTFKELTGFDKIPDDVWSLGFSRDGRTFATGYPNGTVRLWAAGTGQEIGKLEGTGEIALALAFSPDGNTLAVASYNSNVDLWDLNTRRLLATLKGHSGPVRTVAFSPQGTQLASGSDDGNIILWNAVSKTKLSVLAGHADAVRSVAYSPDGSTVASASYDSTVKLWDARAGREDVTLKGHSEGVSSVAFSPDGRTVATGGTDKTVRLWDPRTGQGLAILKGHASEVYAVAFAPDSRMLASGSHDQTVKLWFAATDDEVRARQKK